MFIAALFTTAKIWKKHKYSLTDEWIKMGFIYTVEYYWLLFINNEIWPFAATWMDIEIVILCKVNHKEKEKYHMILLVCGI